MNSPLVINLSLLALGTGVALIGAEGVMRLFAPQPAILLEAGLYVEDATTGYRHQPGYLGHLSNRLEYATQVEINEQGLRGPHIGTDNGQTRLIVLGDSFVFGQGVEEGETFSAYLEAALTEQGHDVEALNAGVRGYGTVQEAAWLDRYGMQLVPDVVIVGVFLGNDLSDNATPVAERWRMLAPPRSWHTPITKWLYTHSHVYDGARNWWQQRRRLGAQLPDVAWLRRTYGAANDADRDKELRATEDALDALVDVTRQNDAVLMAVLIPDSTQVESESRAAVEKLLLGTPGFDIQYPNETFSRLLSARDIPYLDLTPIFRMQAQSGEALYYPIDGHWNQAGHKLAADSAAPVIEPILLRLAAEEPSLAPRED